MDRTTPRKRARKKHWDMKKTGNTKGRRSGQKGVEGAGRKGGDSGDRVGHSWNGNESTGQLKTWGGGGGYGRGGAK